MSPPANDDELLLGGAVVVGALLLWKGQTVAAAVEVGAANVTNLFERGAKLSTSTLGKNGAVLEDPDELLQQAADTLGRDVDADKYALARMGRSEGVDGMRLRMHVALNDLDALQAQYGTNVYSSLLALMLHSKVAAGDGHYSQQQLGKRYSTSKDPYEGDYELAEAVYEERAAGIDPTGGATKFADKDSFSSQPGATKTFAENDASWRASGLQPFNADGASNNLVLYRKA